jgi:hypothetical protein
LRIVASTGVPRATPISRSADASAAMRSCASAKVKLSSSNASHCFHGDRSTALSTSSGMVEAVMMPSFPEGLLLLGDQVP